MLSMPSLICNNQDKNTKDLSLRYISLSSRPINSSMISSLLKYLRKVRETVRRVFFKNFPPTVSKDKRPTVL
jgi:hypothetical protein